MQTANELQINTRVTYVPRAFFAKKGERFASARGKRCTGSKILTLALIHTEEIMYGELNRITYGDFRAELAYARDTVCRNLREFVEDGQLIRHGQSKYRIQGGYNKTNAYPVYNFLLTENVDFGKTVKRLSNNAVLALCEMINTRIWKGEKYFVGGVRRVAKMLNVADGTAHGVIKELIGTGSIYRKQGSYDEAGNLIVDNGKGESKSVFTVYEVNSALIRRCSEILNGINKRKNIKKTLSKGNDPAVQPKSDERKGFSDKLAKERAEREREEAERNHRQEASEDLKFRRLEATFAGDKAYEKEKANIKELYAAFLDAIGKNDVARLDETGCKIEMLTEKLKAYILSRGSPPEDIPDKLQIYIWKQ